MAKSKIITTFVFGSGRITKIGSEDFKAKEFFYGYSYFSKYLNTNIVEMSAPNNSKNILAFIDKVLRKLTELPIYTKDIVNIKNIKILKNSKKIIFTTELLALSLLPVTLVMKLFKKFDVFVIVMGLFGRRPENKFVKFIQNVFIKLLASITSQFIFIGKGEFNKAKKDWPKLINKFTYIPFSVDTEFWHPPKVELAKKEGILFVGNDGKRNYRLLLDIAESLPEINFTIITKQIEECEFENVTLVNGNWGEGILTDEEIKSYYQNAKLLILPINQTYQPSGQSVALQSMACGTPVLISKTEGFWDFDMFGDKNNIFFVNSDNLEEWREQINILYSSDDLLRECSRNANSTVVNELSLNKFSKELYNLVKGKNE